MLNPYFFQIPSPELFTEQAQYQITGYAQVENYTLVFWQISKGDEAVTGESLYRDRDLLATGGGELPLYQLLSSLDPNVASATPRDGNSVWGRVNQQVGGFGVPPAISNALRSPQNQVLF